MEVTLVTVYGEGAQELSSTAPRAKGVTAFRKCFMLKNRTRNDLSLVSKGGMG